MLIKEYIKLLIKEELNKTDKTEKDLELFLKTVVPNLIQHCMIRTNSVKVCGYISEDFNKLALDAGFDSRVMSNSRHFTNLVRLVDGDYEVDLSNIQFQFSEDNVEKYNDEAGKDIYSYHGETMETQRLLDIVKTDPFKAIKVTKLV